MFSQGYIQGDEFVTSGISWGPKHPKIIHRTKRALVVKVEGRNGWASRGVQTYYPAEYWLLEILEEDRKANLVRVKMLETREPGTSWHATVTEFIDRADRMERNGK